MRIAGDGNVGIGKVPETGDARLQVKTDTSQSGLSLETTVATEVTAVLKGGGKSAAAILQLSNGDGDVTAKFQQDGNVGIGTTSPSELLLLMHCASGATL